MLLKCNYCDPTVKKGEKLIKSINTETDDFVKEVIGTSKKYYHTECFRKHHLEARIKKHQKTPEEVEALIQQCKENQKLDVLEMEEKDAFFQWVMGFYDADLPSYYYTQVNGIRIGKHKLVKEPVDYQTLKDIYEKMATYLNKLALSKTFDNTSHRIFYDLNVVINNLTDYRKWKERQKQAEQNKIEVQQEIKKAQERKERIEVVSNTEQEFNIIDIMDDLI